MPGWVWRALWVNVKPMRHDTWLQQAAGPWFRAEAVQGAYRKGQQDEADEARQREIEQRKKGAAAKSTPAEAASLERLKGRMGG